MLDLASHSQILEPPGSSQLTMDFSSVYLRLFHSAPSYKPCEVRGKEEEVWSEVCSGDFWWKAQPLTQLDQYFSFLEDFLLSAPSFKDSLPG